MEYTQKPRKRAVARLAGAFVAWVMGSGFATGQELLQFFSSYGYFAYAGIAVNFIGFSVVGVILMETGFRFRRDREFNQLEFFCGRRLGAFYSWVISLMLISTMAVLISGAGATLSEYYGLNHYIGAALMAVMVLLSYVIGFQRFVRIVSMISPLIVIFILTVGIIVICKDIDGIGKVSEYSEALAESNNSPSWLLSAVLYVSLTFIGGSSYYTALGATALSPREVRAGVIIGVTAIMITIAVIVTAMLCNADKICSLEIPNLYLAGKVTPVLGAVFSIMMILGIFSACSVMMWTVCNKFVKNDDRNRYIFAGCLAAGVFLLGLLSFSSLISFLYPFIGYIGLVYMICVIRKGIIRKMREIL